MFWLRKDLKIASCLYYNKYNEYSLREPYFSKHEMYSSKADDFLVEALKPILLFSALIFELNYFENLKFQTNSINA